MILDVLPIEIIFDDAVHPGASVGSEPGAPLCFLFPNSLAPVDESHDLPHWSHGGEDGGYRRKQDPFRSIGEPHALVMPLLVEAYAAGLVMLERGHDKGFKTQIVAGYRFLLREIVWLIA